MKQYRAFLRIDDDGYVRDVLDYSTRAWSDWDMGKDVQESNFGGVWVKVSHDVEDE